MSVSKIVNLVPVLQIFFLYLCLRNPTITHAYPGGVPKSQCASMTPSHNNILPQPSSTSPFTINVDKNFVSTNYGGSVRVTLSSMDPNSRFTGFFAMGHKVKGGGSSSYQNSGLRPSGRIILPSNSRVRHVHCNELQNSTISHNYPVPRSKQTFDWIPPANGQGDYVILASFVRDFQTFWVVQASEIIHVS